MCLELNLFSQVKLPDGSSQKVFVAFVGVKGDWPWQSPLEATFVFSVFTLDANTIA